MKSIPLRAIFIATVAVILLAATAQAQVSRPQESDSLNGRVVPRKVLIIGIDGCRPDALEAANTPNLDRLRRNGLYSNLAQTGDITVSGPGWSSLLTGVWRDKHGVDDNSFSGSKFGQFPHFFTRLKQRRPNVFTASIVQWSPINTEILSDSDYTVTGVADATVASEGAQLLTSGNPDAIFLHFDDVDHAGHASGYSPTVPAYLAAIETTDGHIGTVLNALRPRMNSENWLILVSTDHGGLGTGHGGNTPEERTIFLIAGGNFVPRGTLVTAPGIVDVAASAMYHLGASIDPSWDWDGKPVQVNRGCPDQLKCLVDQQAKTVTLQWEMPRQPRGRGLELFRNGQSIASLPLSTNSYLDTAAGLPADEHLVLNYRLEVTGSLFCSPLLCRGVLSTGNVLFDDDFESYADDAAVIAAGWEIVDENNPVEQATWTMTNPGGKLNPPTLDGWPGDGQFMISDSDWGGSSTQSNPPGSGMSHDFWSPVIDCSGQSKVWLHFDCGAQLNNNGEALFDVSVSDDGGSTWTKALRRVAPARSVLPLPTNLNADGFFGRVSLDVSPIAANEPDFRFRLRHYEPNWDWWIAVDNVIVDDVPRTAGGSTFLLPAETFSAGIPVSWTLSGLNNGTETWHTSDKGNRYSAGAVSQQGVNRLNHPEAAPNFAMLDSDTDPDPAEDEFLITPSVNCTGFTKIYLHFESEILMDNLATAEVLLSLDGGASFEAEPVFSYSRGALFDPGEEPFFARRVLLVPGAAGESTVSFAFHYESPGNRWWWAIDEVRITGD